MVHEFRKETRPARCCEMHTDVWYVCSCGFEHNCGSGDDFNQTHHAHRLTNIEEALGIKYKAGKMTHITREVKLPFPPPEVLNAISELNADVADAQ